jgi:putative spermidine/putrescine transport system permease protein
MEAAVSSPSAADSAPRLRRTPMVADETATRRTLRQAGPSALRAAVALIYVFLLMPILIVVLTSFSPTRSSAFPPTGFSLLWYGEFFKSTGFVDAFKFSLQLGAAAAVIATAIGFASAYAIVRLLGSWRDTGHSLALLPAMIPHILISIALLLALTVIPLPDFGVLLAGHVLICLPFTIAGITASLDGIDPQLEAAALTLGASRLRAMREIVLPLAAPGVLSALIFAFIVSFGDVYIALFLTGPGMTTLPIEIFSYMQWESTPVIAAITSLQIVLILVLGLIVERLVGLRHIMRF